MNEVNPNKILSKYIIDKLDMLENEFCLKLSQSEYDHMWTLKTELDVDHYAHDLIFNKL